jgi:acetyl esterase/lipase
MISRLTCPLLCGAMLAASAQTSPKPEPTFRNAAYGAHERNVLDFWKAAANRPAPLVIFIHGGGFRAGSKEGINAAVLRRLLDGGISVAAINYRLVPQHPLPAAHQDARRALQFVRSKAGEWNIDKTRIGAFGGSAGAQLCMYLAFHDEMAAPASSNPLDRESTRLALVATNGGQTTMDMRWWLKHIPGYTAPHRPASDYFGDTPEPRRDEIVRDISALNLISAGDPPIYMIYSMSPTDAPPPDAAKAGGWRVHHVNFGIELQRRMKELGIPAELSYPGAPADSLADFFLKGFAAH